MEKKILVFDLDDTLYNELNFVYSGFKAVAQFIHEEKGFSGKTIYNALITALERDGRGKIFDTVLAEYGITGKTFIRKCLSVYRLHYPSIKLDTEAKDCLQRFSDHSKYLVTDGNKIVQANKVSALGIAKYFKGIFITHRYGVKNAKPSPYCFFIIAKKEKADPSQVIYIADNISKDFVNLKKNGFKTIRVDTGQYRHIQKPPEFHADITIPTLKDLTPAMIKNL